MTIAIRLTRTCLAVGPLLASTLALLYAHPARAQGQLEIYSRRLSDRVLLTWACHYFQGTNMAVVATDEGLVIIDTGLSPSTVRRQRNLIQRDSISRRSCRAILMFH